MGGFEHLVKLLGKLIKREGYAVFASCLELFSFDGIAGDLQKLGINRVLGLLEKSNSLAHLGCFGSTKPAVDVSRFRDAQFCQI